MGMLGNIFLRFSKSCCLMSFQPLLMLWDNDALRWQMFSFSIGLLQSSGKRENKVRIGNQEWECWSVAVTLNMCRNSKEFWWWHLYSLNWDLAFKGSTNTVSLLHDVEFHRLLADKYKLICQPWKSHTWLWFSSEKGNSSSTQKKTL